MRQISIVLVILLAFFSTAQASGPPEVVATFDASAGHLPEGVSLDRRGNIFVSLGPPFFVGGGYGEIRRIDRNGNELTVVEFPSGPAPAGLVSSRQGTIYFAVPDLSQQEVGVYRTTVSGAERIPGTDDMLVPNGLAFGPRGTLYVSDSALGAIWTVDRATGTGAPWLSHPLLEGCGQVGPNGVAVWKGDVYVANSDKGSLIRIPTGRNGSPLEPKIVAGDDDCDATDELWSIDGIAFDVHGNVYAALVLQNRVVRISLRDGSVSELLTAADGLWNPASLTFGTGRNGRKSLFITNYAVLPPVPAGNLGPAVLKYDVGIPGKPLR